MLLPPTLSDTLADGGEPRLYGDVSRAVTSVVSLEATVAGLAEAPRFVGSGTIVKLTDPLLLAL